ncbi:HEAT repeat domain-containing protein [Candidatus Woesearchaeota archaeon]|nr:HEAT repeat domain-containing protein [Candidatus Woesearchaeota archaeon]
MIPLYALDIKRIDMEAWLARDKCFSNAPNKATAKQQIHDSQKNVRYNAALFLSKIDTTTTEAIPVLIDAIGDDKTECDAIAALGRYGHAAKDAVPVLANLDLMKKYSGEHPSSPAKALERIGTWEAMAALKLLRKWEQKRSERENNLFKALNDPDPDIRGNAAGELFNIVKDLEYYKESNKTKKIASALKHLLKDPQKKLRYRMAIYLSDINIGKPYKICGLGIKPTRKTKEHKLSCLVDVLKSTAPVGGVSLSTEAIPVLIEAIRDNEVDDFSCAAISALGNYGSAASAAVPILADPGLMKRFGYFHAPNPCSLINALWQIGTQAAYDASVPLQKSQWKWSKHESRLLKSLADRNTNERASAARELYSVAMESSGYRRERINAALKLLLHDADKTVRYDAASYLTSITITTEAIPVLIEAVSDKAGERYNSAARYLGRYGPAAKDAVPTLIELMNKKGYSYFWLHPTSEYVSALEQIGTPESIVALKPLRKRELLVMTLLAPFAFLIFIPAMAPLTGLFFGWLFWRSRGQYKKGRKIVYWPMLITILGWAYISYAVMFELNKYGSIGHAFGAIPCVWLSLITTLAGLVPWFISWLLLRLCERHQSAGTTGSSKP